MKSKFILMLLVTSALSCSPFMKYYKYDYNIRSASQVRTVVVTPLDMIMDKPKGIALLEVRKMDTLISNYLMQNGIQVIPNSGLVSAWKDESEKTEGFFDQTTGKLDVSRIGLCLMRSVAQARKTNSADAVIFVQFVKRPARLSGDRVYWDGCSRRLVDDHGDAITDANFTGETEALSLRVQIFSSDHQLVFQNIGGIHFPYILSESYSKKEFIWNDKISLDSTEISEAVRQSFHPFIRWDKYPLKPVFYEEE